MDNTFVFLFKDASGWIKFENPFKHYLVNDINEVQSVLSQLNSDLAEGHYIAGFLSYEAARGLDQAYTTRNDSSFPLLVFAVFKKMHKVSTLIHSGGAFKSGSWTFSQDIGYYKKSIGKIKKYISNGDTYQVNYTFRLKTHFEGDTFSFFNTLHNKQQADYSCYIKFPGYSVCSASPELFFSLDGDTLVSKPMKGTAKRGLSYDADIQQKELLKSADKERAENLMIVDMIRNDMGKICLADSVKVNNLFKIEKYPTVWQMTSEISGKTHGGFSDIINALFPCASITGAPKIRTMEIINELEKYPRNMYTGAMGYFTPHRKAVFNVAIRTAVIDEKNKTAEYGIGSGIVWDSVDVEEYKECLAKSEILLQKEYDFQLLETMLAGPKGVFLLEYHLNRLKQSADYFNFSYYEEQIRDLITKNIKEISADHKFRLLLSKEGRVTMESSKYIIKENSASRKIKFASGPVKKDNVFLYHKTTHRDVYLPAMDQIKKEALDDVILFNEEGQITESTIANIVIKQKKAFLTPPVICGLLNGTFRQSLIDQKMISEKILFKNDLEKAEKIFLINSLQKWNLADLI